MAELTSMLGQSGTDVMDHQRHAASSEEPERCQKQLQRNRREATKRPFWRFSRKIMKEDNTDEATTEDVRMHCLFKLDLAVHTKILVSCRYSMLETLITCNWNLKRALFYCTIVD